MRYGKYIYVSARKDPSTITFRLMRCIIGKLAKERGKDGTPMNPNQFTTANPLKEVGLGPVFMGWIAVMHGEI